MGTSTDFETAISFELGRLVDELVDINSSLHELLTRLVLQGRYFEGIVDELRTINSSLGRVEDNLRYPPK